MIAEGMECINKLRTLNNQIPGEVISAKLSRLESLLKDLFDSVREHPEQMHRMHKLMDYYLPTTLKLVEAYEEFDRVSVPGDDIIAAKAEIENTLDTINQAFTELLNSLFQDAVLDATTDAQVLKTMLAREGLMNEMDIHNKQNTISGGEKRKTRLRIDFEQVEVVESTPRLVPDEGSKIPEVVLTPQEQKMVDDFAAQIDITNTQMVMQYGAGSQKKIADFSESALNNVRTKDMGEKASSDSLKKAATSWKA